jgi:hypothetical protein
MKPGGLIPILLLTAVIFWSCYESPSVVIHEPGVYKGARDPLLARERSDRQVQILHDRLVLIQMDR